MSLSEFYSLISNGTLLLSVVFLLLAVRLFVRADLRSYLSLQRGRGAKDRRYSERESVYSSSTGPSSPTSPLSKKEKKAVSKPSVEKAAPAAGTKPEAHAARVQKKKTGETADEPLTSLLNPVGDAETGLLNMVPAVSQKGKAGLNDRIWFPHPPSGTFRIAGQILYDAEASIPASNTSRKENPSVRKKAAAEAGGGRK